MKITDEALKAAVELSSRYITDRYLPDKAIDLIDEAGSRIRLKSVTPPMDLNKLETKFDRQLNNHRIGLSCRLARFIHFTKNKLYFQESLFDVAEYLGVVEAEILKVLNEFEKKGMISRSDQGYHIINEGLLLDYTELE